MTRDPLTFSVTFDYRCPFARNGHEHVLEALAAGAGWSVTFLPFSLSQTKVGEGEPDVWDQPDRDSGLLALQVGVAVRDHTPDAFPAVHRALFAARHDEARDLRDAEVLRTVLTENGVDPAAVWPFVDNGEALETIRKEHERAVADHDVFGVPTFIAGGRAVFVRVMDRPEGDADRARTTIERIVGMLVDWPELNEFKLTRIER